jgi:hypothetical protein
MKRYSIQGDNLASGYYRVTRDGETNGLASKQMPALHMKSM